MNKPGKLAACELTLKGSHRELGHKESALATLRDFKFLIAKQWAERARNSRGNKASGRGGAVGSLMNGQLSDGLNFDDLFYYGPLADLREAEGERIIQRLNGLEETLTKTNLEAQYFTTEMRGEAVTKALEILNANEPEVRRAYKDAKKSFTENYMYRRPMRAVIQVLMGLMVVANGSNWGFLIDTVFFKQPGEVAVGFALLQFYNAYFISESIGEYFKYNRQRLAMHYHKMKKALGRVSEPEYQDHFFMSSQEFSIPIEFHKYLMTSDTQPPADEYIQSAREEVVGSRDGGELSHWERLAINVNKQTLKLLQRYSENAGELERNGFVDHIIYFDQSAQEPVWLSVYRAYRNKPPGRKPSRKKEVKEAKKKSSWLPGAVPTGN